MTALVTPFRNGDLDLGALEKMVEHQLENGTAALVPSGSTGESATMSHDEHVRMIERVVAIVGGRVPVIAGTGSNSTREAVHLTAAAKKAGASAALLISPYYNKPTQEGIYEHYRHIASETGMPLIVYNIPGRTGSKIEATTIARLAEIEGIVGLKEATGSLDEMQEVSRLCGESLEIYSGDDSLTLPMIAAGAVGVISVISNVWPKQSTTSVAAALRGDFSEARREHFKMLPLMRVLFSETNPIPVKAAMAMLGFCSNELRLPLLPMTESGQEKLRGELQRLGLVS